MTALGGLSLARVYFRCPTCGLGTYLLDQRLGLDGLLSRQARRLACWTGGRMAFAQAAETLEQLGGWTVSDELIRQVCQAEATAIAAWRSRAVAAAAGFREADGVPEFQTDAAKVNTETGWRDVEIGIFARRPPGGPATAADWESRDLPRPTARVAFAAIETSEQFGARWRPWAERLGLHDPTRLSVLADGAEWIWDQVALQFPGAAELIDIYHASEHLSDAGKALFGAGTAAVAEWLDAGRQRLLSDGWWGAVRADRAGVGRSARRRVPGGDGRADHLLRQAHRPAELRPSAADRPVDRQRDGRGGGQEPDRQAAQADRRPLEGRQRPKDGRALLLDLQRRLVGVLGRGRLTARIGWRTPQRVVDLVSAAGP